MKYCACLIVLIFLNSFELKCQKPFNINENKKSIDKIISKYLNIFIDSVEIDTNDLYFNLLIYCQPFDSSQNPYHEIRIKGEYHNDKISLMEDSLFQDTLFIQLIKELDVYKNQHSNTYKHFRVISLEFLNQKGKKLRNRKC